MTTPTPTPTAGPVPHHPAHDPAVGRRVPGPAHRAARPGAARPGGRRWLALVAYAAVAVPFAVAVGRLLAAPGAHLTLPDDLALIDLHTREALRWRQQLGVFDHFGWNHPGPTYFYLLSLAYRVLGSGARALFVGATVLNGLAAVGCVAVVHRRAGPGRAVWAAVCVAGLGVAVVAANPGDLTYSEGPLGALVSPWNPTVVLFPLLLCLLLAAAALCRSPLSLLGAVLVGSFVVQTNISSLPVVAATVAVGAAGGLASAGRDRRRRRAGADSPPDGAVPDGVAADTGVPDGAVHDTEAPAATTPAGPEPAEPTPARPTHSRRSIGWAVAGVVALVLMWLPPVVQQFTNHPGNLTLIYRFFTGNHPGQPAAAAWWSLVAVEGVLVRGPSEVMDTLLGAHPAHAGLAVATTVVLVAAAVGMVVAGVLQRRRFALGVGLTGLVGTAATLVSVTRVVGPIYGYLVIWAVAVPASTAVGVGLLRRPRWAPRPAARVAAGGRIALAGVAGVVAVVLTVQVVTLPPLERVSDPVVGDLTALVTPHLQPGQTVYVADDGFQDAHCQPELIPLEQFIGLVNQLDQRGFRPRVNHLWQPQFGPGFISDGQETTQVALSQWTPASVHLDGYVGKAGGMAVTVSDHPVTPPTVPCTPYTSFAVPSGSG